MTDLNSTPKANRTHIAFFGKRNAGKSSLINALVGQDVAIVSDVAGTTTDPVSKAMEIQGLGACVFVDTAGFDDSDELGALRIKKTREVASKTDIAILLFCDGDIEEELRWYRYLQSRGVPIVCVQSKIDLSDDESLSTKIKQAISVNPIKVSAKSGQGLKELRSALIASRSDETERDITGDLVQAGDFILLVMPQNIQAPKGRLILPQVQTIREILDKKAFPFCTTTEGLSAALANLKQTPKLIITDSQDFNKVAPLTPSGTLLTSFSILFAAYKGDLQYYLESISTLDKLAKNAKILIAECCTHAPLAEDIGREKIPALLRKKISPDLTIDISSGNDFPQDLSPYALIIQCGGCMFTRKHVLSRIERAKEQHIPMTNYGLTIAHLQGLPLNNLALPKD